MIIKSILDNDLYKFTQQAAVLASPLTCGRKVRYVFSNRRPEGKFTNWFERELHQEVSSMAMLRLGDAETTWLRQRVSFLPSTYVEWLRNYKYDPSEVCLKVVDGELELEINGTWERTILWEVPLMAIISELYFRHCDTDWDGRDQPTLALAKKQALEGILYADFGARRRRNFTTQDLIVRTFAGEPNFVGTSNVHLAHKYNVRPIGTMAHEWIMGISALEGIRRANYHALKLWSDIFRGRLGIALTDTFGTDLFFQDFDGYLARLFDGVRHDSGDPFKFGEKAIAAYEKLGINPKTKTIVFSDGLDCDMARQLWAAFMNRINVSFGIGTHFTNDYVGSKALNMVIKMWSCNGVPVVKLSDVLTKQMGDKDALRVANWIVYGHALDMVA